MNTDPLYAVLAPSGSERLRARLGVGADAPVELATTGWRKVVVLFDSVAVLVPRNHECVPALVRELKVLEALGDVGLPGPPRLLDVIEDPQISPLVLAVVERVDGENLETVEPALSETEWLGALRGVGAAIVSVQDRAGAELEARGPAAHRAVLHGLVDSDRARRLEALEVVAGSLGVAGSGFEALAEAFEPAARLLPVIAHNDLHEAQVMVGPHGVTGIIDWPAASLSHPFVDFDVLQWGRGALARFAQDVSAHRRAMWQGTRGDERYGEQVGALLELAWTLNDGWWASTRSVAPVTGFALPAALRKELIDRARGALGGPG